MTRDLTPIRRRAAAIGAWTLLVTGVAHLATVAADTSAAVPADQRGARDAMTGTSMTMLGVDRTLWQLFIGFSLAQAVLLIGLGAVNLLAMRRAPQLFTGTRSVLGLDLAVVLVLLGTAVALLPPPPIALLGVAALAFGTAVVARA